ncbi:hypothetical protein C0J52_06866, partial [Blattella germanica]
SVRDEYYRCSPDAKCIVSVFFSKPQAPLSDVSDWSASGLQRLVPSKIILERTIHEKVYNSSSCGVSSGSYCRIPVRKRDLK